MSARDKLDELLGRLSDPEAVKSEIASALQIAERRGAEIGEAHAIIEAAQRAKQKYGVAGASAVLNAAGINKEDVFRAIDLAQNEVAFQNGFIRHTKSRLAHLMAAQTFLEDEKKEKPGTLCVHTRPFLAGNLRLACHDLLLAARGPDQSMLWSIKREDGSGPDSFYDKLSDAIIGAQKFDLRSIQPDDFSANASFADDLETHDLLRLPFPFTLYEWSLTEDSEVVVIWRDDDLNVPAFGPFVRIPHNGWARWAIPDVNERPFDAQARLISRAATVILQSRSAEKATVEPPAKLNQRRIATGKLPLFEHTVVEIRGIVLGPHGMGAGERVRRSPRMHWRRGHLRHFRDGSGAVYRITPIAPMLVGAEALGKIEHDYMVSGSRSPATDTSRQHAGEEDR